MALACSSCLLALSGSQLPGDRCAGAITRRQQHRDLDLVCALLAVQKDQKVRNAPDKYSL